MSLEEKIEKYIEKDAEERNRAKTERAILSNDLEYIKEALARIEKQQAETLVMVSDKYVTKVEFEPVKRVVYGLVALVLTGVITALIALVVQS